MKKIFLILSILLLIALPLQAQKINISPATPLHCLTFYATSVATTTDSTTATFYTSTNMHVVGAVLLCGTTAATLVKAELYQFTQSTNIAGSVLLTASTASTNTPSTNGISSVDLPKGGFYKWKITPLAAVTLIRIFMYYTQ